MDRSIGYSGRKQHNSTGRRNSEPSTPWPNSDLDPSRGPWSAAVGRNAGDVPGPDGPILSTGSDGRPHGVVAAGYAGTLCRSNPDNRRNDCGRKRWPSMHDSNGVGEQLSAYRPLVSNHVKPEARSMGACGADDTRRGVAG